MIKIPKSLDELKKIVSDANVNDMINKVKSGINTATETVKSAAESMNAAKPIGEIKDVFDNFTKANQQQQDCIKQLQSYIKEQQVKIETLEAELAALKPQEPAVSVQSSEVQHEEAQVTIDDADKNQSATSNTSKTE